MKYTIYNFIKFFICGALIFSTISCNKFLDVIPDNITSIEDAFINRDATFRMLHHCYGYLPNDASLSNNPGFLGGDEYWVNDLIGPEASSITGSLAWRIPRGDMSTGDPLLNYWDGGQGGRNLYQGIRDCNIFIENVDLAHDLGDFEKQRWIAEVTFLKAYFHFYLLRMYGPIVLIDENKPIFADPDEVRIPRSSIDESVDFIVSLIDECVDNLPDEIEDRTLELGRVTKPAALALKAKVLLTAASPLFNGNTDMAFLLNHDGKQLFNQNYDPKKWEKAMLAADEAINYAKRLGAVLFKVTSDTYPLIRNVSDETLTMLSYQAAVTDDTWHKELIWGLTYSTGGPTWLQGASLPKITSKLNGQSASVGATFKIAESFYSNNGVPIEEDIDWIKEGWYANRYNIQQAGADHKYYIKTGETTALVNFNRESRYYASIAFDRGMIYGFGRWNDGSDGSQGDTYHISARFGETASRGGDIRGWSVTGFWPKKMVNFNGSIANNNFVSVAHAWPVFRLADLYLMYAEAANEFSGPSAQVYEYLDEIRSRSGLGGVVKSWANHSINPTKPTSKEGLRDIIQRERTIELAFEGSRFWDIRRWKTAEEELNRTVLAWNTEENEPVSYYQPKVVSVMRFGVKDYFWPLKSSTIQTDKSLIQNFGWK